MKTRQNIKWDKINRFIASGMQFYQGFEYQRQFMGAAALFRVIVVSNENIKQCVNIKANMDRPDYLVTVYTEEEGYHSRLNDIPVLKSSHESSEVIEMKKFDQDFLLGASTVAHQVDGNNTKSDYWAMEQVKDSIFKEPSLDSVDTSTATGRASTSGHTSTGPC